MCCKGRAVFYVNEFPEKIISEDTIITREPWLFLLNTNAELNQRRLKHFLTVRTLATTDVKPHRWRNASTSRSFIAKSSMNFTFIQSVKGIKSRNLIQMKVLPSVLKVTLSFLLELFDMNDFESDSSEEKKYKIESFANEISLNN